MSTELEVKIDTDIEEMLKSVVDKQLAKRLVLFNDSTHDMLEVLRAVVKAREAGGQPCTPEAAHAIMMEAHSKGQGVVMSGLLENLKKAQAVLEGIELRTDIID